MPIIVIIDDNELNLEMFSDLLMVANYSIFTATTAEEGIYLARRELPDLIIMDVSMPGMDGLTATKLLKGDGRTKDIPVVILTSNAMKADAEKAKTAGSSGYLTKPINTRTFAETIGRFLVDTGEIG